MSSLSSTSSASPVPTWLGVSLYRSCFPCKTNCLSGGQHASIHVCVSRKLFFQPMIPMRCERLRKMMCNQSCRPKLYRKSYCTRSERTFHDSRQQLTHPMRSHTVSSINQLIPTKVKRKRSRRTVVYTTVSRPPRAPRLHRKHHLSSGGVLYVYCTHTRRLILELC